MRRARLLAALAGAKRRAAAAQHGLSIRDVAAARMAMLDAGGGGATAGGASSMRAHVSGSAGGDRGMFAGLTGLLNAFSSGGPGDSDGGFRR